MPDPLPSPDSNPFSFASLFGPHTPLGQLRMLDDTLRQLDSAAGEYVKNLLGDLGDYVTDIGTNIGDYVTTLLDEPESVAHASAAAKPVSATRRSFEGGSFGGGGAGGDWEAGASAPRHAPEGSVARPKAEPSTSYHPVNSDDNYVIAKRNPDGHHTVYTGGGMKDGVIHEAEMEKLRAKNGQQTFEEQVAAIRKSPGHEDGEYVKVYPNEHGTVTWRDVKSQVSQHMAQSNDRIWEGGTLPEVTVTGEKKPESHAPQDMPVLPTKPLAQMTVTSESASVRALPSATTSVPDQAPDRDTPPGEAGEEKEHKIRDFLRDVGHKIEDAADKAADFPNKVKDKVERAAHDVGDRVRDAVKGQGRDADGTSGNADTDSNASPHEIISKMENAADKVVDFPNKVKDRVEQAAHDVGDRVRGAVESRAANDETGCAQPSPKMSPEAMRLARDAVKGVENLFTPAPYREGDETLPDVANYTQRSAGSHSLVH